MNDWTLDELICATATMMSDLRGNWGYEYGERIDKTILLLMQITEHKEARAEQKLEALADITVARSELNDQYDGRIFRDNCHYYGKPAPDGKTDRVKEYLQQHLTHPEFSWITEDNDNQEAP